MPEKWNDQKNNNGKTTAWKAKCPIFLGNFSPKT